LINLHFAFCTLQFAIIFSFILHISVLQKRERTVISFHPSIFIALFLIFASDDGRWTAVCTGWCIPADIFFLSVIRYCFCSLFYLSIVPHRVIHRHLLVFCQLNLELDGGSILFLVRYGGFLDLPLDEGVEMLHHHHLHRFLLVIP